MRRGARALTLAALTCVAGCAAAPTEILLVVSANGLAVPTDLDALHIEAYGDTSLSRLTRDYDLSQPAHALPLSLGLVPGPDTGPVLHVVVTGTRNGVVVDEQTATTSFVANQTGRLEVRLEASGGQPTERPPAMLGTTGETDTPVRGPPTTAPIARNVCPAGSVVVGFDFSVDQQVVNGVRPLCGVPSVAGPGPSIVLAAGQTLPWQGDNQSGNAPSFCPTNQVVVGFDSRHGLLIDSIALRCAPLELDGHGGVAVGPATDLPPIGGDGGGANPTTNCGAGMIAGGTQTRTDAWLSGFGLICTTVVAR